MGKGINPNLSIKSRTLKSAATYLQQLRDGDRFALSEVLTLIESKNREQRSLGENILSAIDPNPASIRIGITGSPGAGKSTFIEALGSLLTSRGHKVAVLAVDPSSTVSHGSILGDKTRMQRLGANPNAFVRPTASANILGGVARATKESIALCEATGYDLILIESVGVGQSETDLSELVDCYLLLLLPGGGDGVQGIKRGVVELADIMVINKNDGDQKVLAEKSKRDFASAAKLFHHPMAEWEVPVRLASALHDQGIELVWESIEQYIKLSRSSLHFSVKRASQDRRWIKNQIDIQLMSRAQSLFGDLTADSHISDVVDVGVFQSLKDISDKIEEIYLKYQAK